MSQSDRASFAEAYVEGLSKVLAALPFAALARAMEVLERAADEGRSVFIAGNGGSAATASHMANDFLKGAQAGGGPGLRAISLADGTALLTAVANDLSYEQVFAEPLRVLARRGDVLVLISGSGNSPNIVRAAAAASELGLVSIAFLGKGGGLVRDMVDVEVTVPSDDYGPIEDAHMCLDHLITAWLVKRGGAGSARRG